MLVASRLLSQPEAYRRWEAEHSQLMRRVSSHRYLNRQVVALRSTALTLMHRKAVFEYLQERQLTRLQRHKLMAMFHSLKDYSASLIAEHGNYLRGASSYWCSHHLARRLMKDGAFAEPLLLYQERYTDYFRVHCDVELAETEQERQAVDSMRMLQPLLKLQLAEARAGDSEHAVSPRESVARGGDPQAHRRYRAAADSGRPPDRPDPRQARQQKIVAPVSRAPPGARHGVIH